MTFVPKIYKRQIFRKIRHQNRNQHITMCPCTKFHSVWKTDFGTKFSQNYMNENFFEKINIKIIKNI